MTRRLLRLLAAAHALGYGLGWLAGVRAGHRLTIACQRHRS